jgi:hypothetical protein
VCVKEDLKNFLVVYGINIPTNTFEEEMFSNKIGPE